MKLLLINNYDSFTYNLVALLKQIPNVVFDIVNNDDTMLLQPLSYSHILISPGPDLPMQAGNLMQCLQLNYKTKSILGICLGHQALAQLLGCTLYQLAVPQHGLRTTIHFTPTALFHNIMEPCHIGLYHSWAISNKQLPAHIQVLATDNHNIVMAFKHNALPLFGVQFHPESYMSNQGMQLLKNWLAL